MNNIHFLNGEFVKEENLLISPRDLGYSRGYGVFDFLITYNQRPFLLDKHINRLFSSAKKLSLTIPWSQKVVSEWVLQTLKKNSHILGEKVIRISISGGVAYGLKPNTSPTIIITVDSHIPCPDLDYINGVEIKLEEFQRYMPEAKSNNYIQAIKSFQELSTDLIDEIIYYSNNMVLEGTRCNIFALINGNFLTPKDNILK